MESYPNGARAFTPSATFATSATPDRANAPARNPIGVWFKTPWDTDTDPCTIALAVPSARFGPLAITIATGIRARLVSFMARDPHNTDGNTRRYGAGVLAIVTAWPDDCGSLADALESSGITTGGYYKHWQYITGNPSRADLRRSSNRVSKRISRARAAGHVLTSADIAMTSSSPTPGIYKERAHVTRPESVKVKKTLSPRDASHKRRETTATITPAKPVPIAPELAPAARMLVDRFGWTPAHSKLETITATVGDDLKNWQYVLDEYVETDHWHKGPNALKGMLERFQRRQAAMSATMSQTTAQSDGKRTQSAQFRSHMARVAIEPKTAPKRPVTDQKRPESECKLSGLCLHSTDFQGSAPAESAPENVQIAGDTGAGIAPLEAAITLPPPDQWLARTGASDQAWRAIMVNYRRVHGIGPFESVPIANIEKWALEQANRNSQITMLPLAPGGTR
ncbi:MAG: hypothetical protein EBS94_16570 [Proteobacteria bacterium]|nr:hypothetical protein [Pseudomonadota bacterium]